MKKLISILIPCYNEAQSLPILVPKLEDLANNLKQYEWEFLCVNDGSKDNTLEVLRELRQIYKRVNYIDLSRNYGKENACRNQTLIWVYRFRSITYLRK